MGLHNATLISFLPHTFWRLWVKWSSMFGFVFITREVWKSLVRPLVVWRRISIWAYGHQKHLVQFSDTKPLLTPIKAHLDAALSSLLPVFFPGGLVFLSSSLLLSFSRSNEIRKHLLSTCSFERAEQKRMSRMDEWWKTVSIFYSIWGTKCCSYTPLSTRISGFSLSSQVVSVTCWWS